MLLVWVECQCVFCATLLWDTAWCTVPVGTYVPKDSCKLSWPNNFYDLISKKWKIHAINSNESYDTMGVIPRSQVQVPVMATYVNGFQNCVRSTSLSNETKDRGPLCLELNWYRASKRSHGTLINFGIQVGYAKGVYVELSVHPHTCVLISMLWLRQAIFESKWDTLSSSAECRIRT